MLVKKIYTVVKIALCIFIVCLSLFIDFIIMSGEPMMLFLFVPLEVLILVYSYLLFRYIDKIILTMEERKGFVRITTFGSAYKTKLSNIRVIKGKWNFYYVNFDGNKLRVYPSNKKANVFIKKFFVRISG